MTAWEGGFERALEAARDAFGIHPMDPGMHPALARVKQTGFVWTRQAGVACLAADRRYLALALDNPSVVAVIVPRIRQQKRDQWSQL